MTDEASRYSPFWPVTIVLAAFAISYLYQIVEIVSQRSLVNTQYTQASPEIPKAQEAHDRLVALLKDIATLAPKDPNALQVMRLSLQSGILQRSANAGATNAPSATPPAANP